VFDRLPLSDPNEPPLRAALRAAGLITIVGWTVAEVCSFREDCRISHVVAPLVGYEH